MIQKLPDTKIKPEHWADEKEPWREAAFLAATLKASELLDPSLHTNNLLRRLFHEYNVQLFKLLPIRHACRCSRKRVAYTLSSFPDTEINALKEDGIIRVTCEFCTAEYLFNELDLQEIYEDINMY